MLNKSSPIHVSGDRYIDSTTEKGYLFVVKAIWAIAVT